MDKPGTALKLDVRLPVDGIVQFGLPSWSANLCPPIVHLSPYCHCGIEISQFGSSGAGRMH